MQYFLIFVFVFMVQGVYSQEKGAVRFGLKAGANFSHINFSEGSLPLEAPLNTNWQPGLVAGFVVLIPLTHNLYFQPEYLFSQMGGKFKNQNREIDISYASFPVLLKWEFLNKITLLGGPQFDLLINATEKSGNINSSIDHYIEHRSIFITGGLEYYFTDKVIMGMRYLHGLNHVDIIREDGNQEFKYDGMQITLYYLF